MNIGNQLLLLDNAQALHDIIEKCPEGPTATNMLQLFHQMINLCRSINCEIPDTNKRNWSFILFTDAAFGMLDGNKTPAIAANLTAIPQVTAEPEKAGPPITPPQHPGKATSARTSTAAISIYNYEREQANKYRQVLQLLRLCFTQAYGEGDYLLDLQDKYGNLTMPPLEMYNQLWESSITRHDKDSAILKNWEVLRESTV
jgi:hypothetical protein